MNLSLKQKIIAAVILIGAALIAIFQVGLGGSFTRVDTGSPATSSNQAPQKISFSDELAIVSMSPAPLMEKKDIVVVPTQVIEVTFNKRLENGPETKVLLDPPAEVRVELSDDHMSAKIIPVKPYKLGQGYTLFLKGDTKFEGGKTLGRDEDFHFSTINYNGV